MNLPEGFELEDSTPTMKLPEGFELEDSNDLGSASDDGFKRWQKENGTGTGFEAWQKENTAANQPQTPDGLVKRFGKQLYNQGIANTLKSTVFGLGGGRILNLIAARHLHNKAAEMGEDLSTSQAYKLMKAGAMQQLNQAVPSAEVAPPKTLIEKITDVGAGLAAMAGQIALTKKILPAGTPEPVVWEVQNLANGGTPGHGAALGAIFHGINKIPAKTLAGKAGKLALESGSMGGLTALEGGSPEDIAIAAAVPAALKTVGSVASIVRGQPEQPIPDPKPVPPGRDQVLKAPVAPEKMPFVRKVGEQVVVQPAGMREQTIQGVRLKTNDPEEVEQELLNQGFSATDARRYANGFEPDTSTTVRPTTTVTPRKLDPAKADTVGTFEYDVAQYAKQNNVSLEEAQKALELSRTTGTQPSAVEQPVTEEPAAQEGESVEATKQALGVGGQVNEAEPEGTAPTVEPTTYTYRERTPQTISTEPVYERGSEVPYDQETKTAIQYSKEMGISVDETVQRLRRLRSPEEQAVMPLTQEEKSNAKQLGLPEPKDMEGTRKSLLLAGGLTEAERGKISEIADTPEALDKTLQWAWNSGDLPSDPEARKAYLSNVQEAANGIRKLEARRANPKKADLFGWREKLQTIDAVLNRVELAAGRPLRTVYHGMVAKARQARQRANDLVVNTLKSVVDLKKYRPTTEENDNLAWFLFKGEKSRFDALSKDGRKVAIALRSILSDYSADRIRAYRFWRWQKFGEVPPDVPEAKRDEVLEAGRVAQEQGHFDEWIANQKWGTREVYYPAAGEGSSDLGVDELLRPSSLLKGEGRASGMDVGAAHTRTQGKEPVPGNVIANVIRHVTQVDTALALKEDMPKFWEDFQRAEPTGTDNEIMKEFLNNITGRTSHYTWLDRAVSKVVPLFWKGYFLNPLSNGWFSLRNLGQFFAMGPAELQTRSALGAIAKIIDDKAHGIANEQRARHFEEDFASRVRQDSSLYHDAMMDDKGIPSELKSRIGAVADAMGQTAMWSEKTNRLLSWSVAHQMAQTATEALEAGKIGVEKVRSRLLLDSMSLSQRVELDRYLTAKDYDTFIRRYAEYKCDAINFSYDTALRSAVEQTPAGRALAGIMVFPRGVYNIGVKNGLVPIAQGWEKGDYNQMTQGIRNIAALYVAASATDWVYQQVTGKKGTYSLPGLMSYTPLAPGLSVIAQTCGDISRAFYRRASGETTLAGEAAEIVAALSKPAEIAFPLSTAIEHAYAVSKDVEDVKLWSMVRADMDRKYAQAVLKKNERTGYQTVMHLLFGGFNKPEKKRPQSGGYVLR